MVECHVVDTDEGTMYLIIEDNEIVASHGSWKPDPPWPTAWLDAMAKARDETYCDFCSAPNPAWGYAAHDFTVPTQKRLRSRGAWLACDTCHDLIELGDRKGLTNRSTEIYMVKHNHQPSDREPLRRSLGHLHQTFWDARIGGARRALDV